MASRAGAQDAAGEASNISELLSLEQGAAAALTIDAWVTSNEDLVAAEFAVSRNLAAQQAAAARAEWLAVQAAGRSRVAGEVRRAAEVRRDIVEGQMVALTVEAFMYAGEARIGGFGNELQQVRDVTPNETVAKSLLLAIERMEDQVQILRVNEQTMVRRQESARQTADDRAAALRRAQGFITQFDSLKSNRTDQIRVRKVDVLEESKVPARLVTVRGFVVDASIAENLDAMIAAALEEEIVIGGWGYRSTEEQILLRLEHCGNSGDAIFDLNANSCNPPTAQPLRSEHEKGLALDFTEGGAVLNRGSAAFAWLKEHAAEYGFLNLPTEAWHWSTTGH